jgi:TRAP-type C4-dicarboxylate transport system permease small subunit
MAVIVVRLLVMCFFLFCGVVIISINYLHKKENLKSEKLSQLPLSNPSSSLIFGLIFLGIIALAFLIPIIKDWIPK